MSGPPKWSTAATATYIATLPLNTGGPLKKIAREPRLTETSPTNKGIRRTPVTYQAAVGFSVVQFGQAPRSSQR